MVSEVGVGMIERGREFQGCCRIYLIWVHSVHFGQYSPFFKLLIYFESISCFSTFPEKHLEYPSKILNLHTARHQKTKPLVSKHSKSFSKVSRSNLALKYLSVMRYSELD